MTKRKKRFTSLALAMALIATSLVSGTPTKVMAADLTASTDQTYIASVVYVNEPGDTTVIDSISEIETVATPFYVLSEESSFLMTYDKYLQLNDCETLLQEEINSVYVPDYGNYDADLATYTNWMANEYDNWVATTPNLANYTDDTTTNTAQSQLDAELTKYLTNNAEPVAPTEPIQANYKMDDLTSYTVAHEAWLSGGEIGDEPVQSTYQMDDVDAYTAAHATWDTNNSAWLDAHTAWESGKPTLGDFSDIVTITKTAQEKYNEDVIAHDSLLVFEPIRDNYVVMSESVFNEMKTVNINARTLTRNSARDQFDAALLELKTIGIKTVTIVPSVPSTPSTPTIVETSTPVETTPIYVPTKEEAVRIGLTSSVPIEAEVVKEDGTKSETIVKNSIQGPRCYEAFSNAKPEDSEIVRTLSIFADGNKGAKPVYKTETPEVITLTIPKDVKVVDGKYSLVCVSENGVTTVFEDEDTNPDTITITTDVYYAYALCVE